MTSDGGVVWQFGIGKLSLTPAKKKAELALFLFPPTTHPPRNSKNYTIQVAEIWHAIYNGPNQKKYKVIFFNVDPPLSPLYSGDRGMGQIFGETNEVVPGHLVYFIPFIIHIAKLSLTLALKKLSQHYSCFLQPPTHPPTRNSKNYTIQVVEIRHAIYNGPNLE